MFKGYLPTGGKDGKTPAEEYKDRTEFYKLSEVENLKSYGGVLKDGLIQIDIDDEESANTLYKIVCDMDLKCNVLQTSRGKHFYFTNTDVEKRKQGYSTAIGIKIDVGLGVQNAVVPLKIKDNVRVLLREFDTLEELPAWLKPLTKKEINFKSMTEGDGRNQALFNYILTLQQNAIGKAEIKETIKIINKYILQEELPEKEIETILRDESFLKESFYIKGKLQYEALAKYLRDNEKIIKINDTLHIYKDGVYTNNLNSIEKKLLKYINNSTKNPRSEILRYLELLCENKNQSSFKYILLNNGVYNLETKELEEFNSNLIIKNKIPISFNPSAYSEIMDKTLDNICCNDNSLRLIIEEMVGYTLLRRNEIGKAFILTGGGSNGKSTLLDIMEDMLGEDNLSSVSMNELSERFKTFQLEGKLANIGDDISNKYIEDNSTFKKLVTGEKVNVERKGKDAFDFRNYSKLIFSANELPRINDLSDGLKRRIMFIPFNAKFKKSDVAYDPFIKDKLSTNEALEYLLKIAIEGLHRILLNNSFTISDASTRVWEEYESVNNPVIAFLDETEIDGKATGHVYKQYQVWCIESGLKSLSKTMLGKEIKKHGYQTDGERPYINGKRTRIYSKVGQIGQEGTEIK